MCNCINNVNKSAGQHRAPPLKASVLNADVNNRSGSGVQNEWTVLNFLLIETISLADTFYSL